MSAPARRTGLLLALIIVCVLTFSLVECFGDALHLSRTWQHRVGMTAFIAFLGLLSACLRNRKPKG